MGQPQRGAAPRCSGGGDSDDGPDAVRSQYRGRGRDGGATRRDVIDEQHTRDGPSDGTEPGAAMTRRARAARLRRARKPGEHRPRRSVERPRERTRQQCRRIEPTGPVPGRGRGRPGDRVRALDARIAHCCRHRQCEPRDRRPGIAVLHPRHQLPRYAFIRERRHPRVDPGRRWHPRRRAELLRTVGTQRLARPPAAGTARRKHQPHEFV
jgi:hypothetical protein